MEEKQGLTTMVYHNYRLIAALPALCVILDYAMTFFFAGDTAIIASWEASPFVRFAVINNIMVPYVVGIILFYYGSSYAILHILAGTDYYKFGVTLIVVLAVTHVIGGMSWYFRNAMYSDGVMMISTLSIVIAFLVFGFSLIHEHRPTHP